MRGLPLSTINCQLLPPKNACPTQNGHRHRYELHPVDVDITQCWVSMDIGFWTVEVKMDVEINFKSPIGLDGDVETVNGTYYINSPAVVDSAFSAVIDDALENVTANLKTKLKKP
jgi:hypothetical protein